MTSDYNNSLFIEIGKGELNACQAVIKYTYAVHYEPSGACFCRA